MVFTTAWAEKSPTWEKSGVIENTAAVRLGYTCYRGFVAFEYSFLIDEFVEYG